MRSDSDSKLGSFRMEEQAANLDVVRRCLECLHQSILSNESVDLKDDCSHRSAFPFRRYSTVYWPVHARTLAQSEDIVSLYLQFFQEGSEVCESWLKTYLPSFGRYPRHYEALNSTTSAQLHWASYFGTSALVNSILGGKDRTIRSDTYINMKCSTVRQR